MELYFKYHTLKSVTELFGLFRNHRTEAFDGLDYSYLDQYLSTRFSQKVRMQMLDYYRDYVLSCNTLSEDEYELRITQHLNQLFGELSKSQKAELYIALLIYVVDSEKVAGGNKALPRLMHQLKLVSNIFDLDETRIMSVTHFVRNDLSLEQDPKGLVMVGNFTKVKLRSFRMYNKVDLKGKIMAYYVPSISSFLIKYIGKGQLQLNKQVLFPDRVYQFTLGGIIEGEICNLYILPTCMSPIKI